MWNKAESRLRFKLTHSSVSLVGYAAVFCISPPRFSTAAQYQIIFLLIYIQCQHLVPALEAVCTLMSEGVEARVYLHQMLAWRGLCVSVIHSNAN